MGPNCFLVSVKALFTAAASTMSATKVRTETPECSASTSFLVERRAEAVRPMMTIFVAPDFAKAWTIRGPIPFPPKKGQNVRVKLPKKELFGVETCLRN
jgi:hypothetical protein